MHSSVSVSEPIWFTLIRIELATPISMPLRRRSVLVTNRSSPTSCTLLAEPLGDQLPAVPVVLGHAVLDGDDRVAIHQAGLEVDHLGGGELAALAFQHVDAALGVEDLGGRRVQRDADLLAERVAGLLAWPRR